MSFVALGASSGCGGSEATTKALRDSERLYEAASIAFYEEHDELAAIRNLTRAIELNPENSMARYMLGTIRFGRHEMEEADKQLSETVRLRAERGDDVAGLAAARNNLGLLRIHQERYTEAIELLEASATEVMNREPWLAFGNWGWALIELGEYDAAIEKLKRALFDQPQYCVGMYRLGQAHYFNRDYENAEASLRSALAVNSPGCDRIQEAHHLLGMTLLRLEREDEAKEALEECRSINVATESGKSCSEALQGL